MNKFVFELLNVTKSNEADYLLIAMHYSPGNIRVFCRVRPFHHEESYQSRTLFTLDESNVFLKVAETKIKQYKFDKVFNQCSTQGTKSVFPFIGSVVLSEIFQSKPTYNNPLSR